MTAIPDPYTNPHALQRVQGVTAPQNFALRKVIEGHGDVLGAVCRSHKVDPEAVIAQLWVASQKNQDLLKATPASLVSAVARAIETGGTIGRDVNILVFGNEAMPHVHYKYEAEMVVAAGGARALDMNNVHKGDVFKEVKGSHPQLVHELPPLGQERGPIIGSYAIAYFGGTVPPRWVTLPLEKIEKIRAKSKAWSKGPMPDWYGPKSAMHQLVKILPKNPKLAALVLSMRSLSDVDDDEIVVDGPLEVAPEVELSAPSAESSRDADKSVSPELARALAFQVKGRALSELANDELTKLEQWAHDKGNTRVADYCGIVLHHRTLAEATRQLDLEPAA